MKNQNTITAEQAIAEIASIKTTFFGMQVQKYNYAIEIRAELQKYMSAGKISLIEYWKALKITFPKMSEAEKTSELEKLSA